MPENPTSRRSSPIPVSAFDPWLSFKLGLDRGPKMHIVGLLPRPTSEF